MFLAMVSYVGMSRVTDPNNLKIDLQELRTVYSAFNLMIPLQESLF